MRHCFATHDDLCLMLVCTAWPARIHKQEKVRKNRSYTYTYICIHTYKHIYMSKHIYIYIPGAIQCRQTPIQGWIEKCHDTRLGYVRTLVMQWVVIKKMFSHFRWHIEATARKRTKGRERTIYGRYPPIWMGYICIRLHMYSCVHMCMYIHVYICICICIYLYMCVSKCIYCGPPILIGVALSPYTTLIIILARIGVCV